MVSTHKLGPDEVQRRKFEFLTLKHQKKSSDDHARFFSKTDSSASNGAVTPIIVKPVKPFRVDVKKESLAAFGSLCQLLGPAAGVAATACPVLANHRAPATVEDPSRSVALTKEEGTRQKEKEETEEEEIPEDVERKIMENINRQEKRPRGGEISVVFLLHHLYLTIDHSFQGSDPYLFIFYGSECSILNLVNIVLFFFSFLSIIYSCT